MTHESSGSGSSEHEKPLSATAMFLRSLEEPAVAPAVAKEEAGWPASPPVPVPPPANFGPAGPGEFTQMFQLTPRQESAPPVASAPAAVPAPGQAPGAGSGGGQGEFTRIFHTGSVNQEAKTVIEPPPYAPPAAPPLSGASRKGFSTPGVSDSASAEGSFTQIFKPVAQSAPVAPPIAQAAPASVAHVPVAEPVLPNPAYVPESSWKAEPEFAAPSKPAAGASVTQLISSLGGSQSSSSGRAPEPAPYAPAPVPVYTPPPQLFQQQEAAHAQEAGSVTQLIQRLAQTPAAPPPPVAPMAPVAPANSGPGEFTRMISAAAFASAAAAPPPAPAAAQPLPATPQFPAAPAFAMPPVAPLPMPHLQAGAPAGPPFPMPMPQVQMPKPPALPPAPQIAAPKGKLEAMVPVLLIVNTFLLVLVLVVVLFALKGH